jgi:folate-dependent phosphoribosylglycinamide formyltransferase PurN
VHLVNAKVDSGKLISQEFINQDEMDNYKIETVLSKITPLICTCLEHSIDALTTNKISEKLPENNDSFKAYLEPGITDYIKFIKGCHKR